MRVVKMPNVDRWPSLLWKKSWRVENQVAWRMRTWLHSWIPVEWIANRRNEPWKTSDHIYFLRFLKVGTLNICLLWLGWSVFCCLLLAVSRQPRDGLVSSTGPWPTSQGPWLSWRAGGLCWQGATLHQPETTERPHYSGFCKRVPTFVIWRK